jgi:hypothetical protein
MSKLSDNSLPYLDRSLDELKKTEVNQAKKFPRETYYMTFEEYHNRIQNRKNNFRKKYEAKSWLSWNFPEHMAYKTLRSTGK